MLRSLIKSFLRRPIFQSKRGKNHSGERKGNWGEGGLEGKQGGEEGFSRSTKILFGATAFTGITFLCTETCPYSGQNAHPPLFLKNHLFHLVGPMPLFDSTDLSGRRRISLLPGTSGREVLARKEFLRTSESPVSISADCRLLLQMMGSAPPLPGLATEQLATDTIHSLLKDTNKIVLPR